MPPSLMGSLSTVSTWINELDRIGNTSLSAAYVYAIVSVVVAQLLCLCIGLPWILTGHTIQ
jgi:fluoride ion exporter CrcB/FEX